MKTDVKVVLIHWSSGVTGFPASWLNVMMVFLEETRIQIVRWHDS